MPITVKYAGLDRISSEFRNFSQRRFRSAVATSLTKTASSLAKRWQSQINQRIDRPEARTQKAAAFERATANVLESKVKLRSDYASGTSPADYMTQHQYGGGRLTKKFEYALANSGVLPRGYQTVPGRGAMLNGYGNVSRSQLIAIVSQFGKDASEGYAQTIGRTAAKREASKKKHGKKYILSPIGGGAGVSPGIYVRNGDKIQAVLLFKQRTSYRRRLSLMEQADKEAPEIAAKEFEIALQNSLKRLIGR